MIVTPVKSGGWVIQCPACGMERHAQTALILGRIRYAHIKECKSPEKDAHAARPGPGYWEWRCLACGGDARDRRIHSPLWRRLLARVITPAEKGGV